MSDVVDRERTTSDITEQEKVLFLQNIYQGLNRKEAAYALGYRGKHFRALCSPSSPHYDEDFKIAYDEALGSFEHAESYLERLRAEADRRALLDSDRLLEKLLMVHDPKWSVLRERKSEQNVNIAVLVQQQLKELPTARLQQILDLIEESEVVDGEFAELPPAGPVPPAVDEAA